jgi:archaellum component FlaF (FlaF/FlaG flagellin family)
MKSILFLVVTLISTLSFSQENDDFAKRLKAINNQTIIFYNVDGVDFSSQTFSNEFTEKGLKKLYRKYSIKESDSKIKDETLKYNNFHITKLENVAENISQISSYYFVENQNKTVSVFWFGYYGKQNQEFERKYVNRISNDEIPKEVFEPMTIQSIDFAGRKIELGNSCNWTNINTVQCPYYGEMNWSVHKTIESAKNSIENQFNVTKNRKGGKVLSEEQVDVIFEGTETKAKKVIYDFTGVNSLLVGMSGGKTLTIYYVASKVRENYVSCCMSFWNNDTITENGLAPLLEKVMQLKK